MIHYIVDNVYISRVLIQIQSYVTSTRWSSASDDDTALIWHNVILFNGSELLVFCIKYTWSYVDYIL